MCAMKVVTFKIDEDLLERLDSYARLKGIPRSEVIRQAIMLFLKLNAQRNNMNYRYVRLYS